MEGRYICCAVMESTFRSRKRRLTISYHLPYPDTLNEEGPAMSAGGVTTGLGLWSPSNAGLIGPRSIFQTFPSAGSVSTMSLEICIRLFSNG